MQLDGRVQGTMTGKAAADWLTVDDDGNVTLDIRVVLTTDDGAQIYVHLDGRARVARAPRRRRHLLARHAGGGRRALRVGEPPAAGVEGRGRPRRRRRPRAVRARVTLSVERAGSCTRSSPSVPDRASPLTPRQRFEPTR